MDGDPSSVTRGVSSVDDDDSSVTGMVSWMVCDVSSVTGGISSVDGAASSSVTSGVSSVGEDGNAKLASKSCLVSSREITSDGSDLDVSPTRTGTGPKHCSIRTSIDSRVMRRTFCKLNELDTHCPICRDVICHPGHKHVFDLTAGSLH